MTVASFALDAPPAQYRFSITETYENDDAFALLQDGDGNFELLDYDDFKAKDFEALDDAHSEACDMMDEQIRVWRSLTSSERIRLQIHWTENLRGELEERLRSATARADISESGGLLQDLLDEIGGLNHYIAALHTALMCL